MSSDKQGSDKQAILLKKTTDLLVGTHDFRDLARQVVDLVLKELGDQNLIGTALFRVHEKEHFLYAYTYANKYRKLIDALLPVKFSELNTPMSNAGNFLVKTILSNQVQQSKKLIDFARGALPERICEGMEKIIKGKLWMSLPIRLKSGKAAGAILLVLSDDKISGEQLVLFETLASQLGLAFANVFAFEQLMEKYQASLYKNSHSKQAEENLPSVKFTLRVSPKEEKKLEDLAQQEGKTKAEVLRGLLDKI